MAKASGGGGRGGGRSDRPINNITDALDAPMSRVQKMSDAEIKNISYAIKYYDSGAYSGKGKNTSEKMSYMSKRLSQISSSPNVAKRNFSNDAFFAGEGFDSRLDES